MLLTPVYCQLWSLSILSWSDRGSILNVRALQLQGYNIVIVAEAAHSHLLLKINSSLKVPSGQIGSVWEWYHWIGLEKDINRYRFLFFIFDLGYLIRVQSSEPLHAKMNPTSYLFGSRFACAQTAIFSAELWSKNAGETSIVLWITACE